jgi:hypothetical protein
MRSSPDSGKVSQALHALVAKVPVSAEPAATDPKNRARALANSAALRAAALSGTMSLPPGPFGLLTVLPDLLAVWRLQQQLVADIAATFGKSAQLTPEAMVVCLFKHGSGSVSAELIAPSSTGVLIRRVATSTLQQLLGKISIRVMQRLAAKGFSRWLPVIGALGVGAYAYYDTTQVAATAIELFAQDVVVGDDEKETPAAESEARPSSRRRARNTGGKLKSPRARRSPKAK